MVRTMAPFRIMQLPLMRETLNINILLAKVVCYNQLDIIKAALSFSRRTHTVSVDSLSTNWPGWIS